MAHFGPGLQLRKSASSSRLRVDKGHPTRQSVAHWVAHAAPTDHLDFREATAVPAVLLQCDRSFAGLPVMLVGPAAVPPSNNLNLIAQHGLGVYITHSVYHLQLMHSGIIFMLVQTLAIACVLVISFWMILNVVQHDMVSWCLDVFNSS